MNNQEIYNKQDALIGPTVLEQQLKEIQDFRAYQESLWNAINDYVVLCGGDPSKHVGVARMNKVVEIENLVFQKKQLTNPSEV